MSLRHEQSALTTHDGLTCYRQCWRPMGEPRGVVLIVHGFAEHSGRYAHVAERLVAAGYVVHAYDQRGHGRSDGDRALVTSFADYLRDLDAVLAAVCAEEPALPTFLLGHSMGGGVVALFVVTRRPDLAGVILSGAATAAPNGAVGIVSRLLATAGRIAPRLPMRTLAAAAVSRDPAVIEEYDADPLNYRGPLRLGMVRAFNRSARRIERDAALFELPVLIAHGTADALVNVEASRSFHDAIGSTDKTLREYDGLYHEILNEPERDQVLDDIIAWLDTHTP